MANLLSPGTLFAGLFFDAILTGTGTPVTLTPVTVYQSDGTTPAVCYTDQTKTATTSNTINTDGYGNLVFYTNPGIYVLGFTVGGTPSTKTVQINPWYSDAAWNIVVDTSSASPVSGDCRLANASSGSILEELPTPLVGARVKIVKTDSSGNGVEIGTPSGAIFGPGLGSGQSSITLTAQGLYTEFAADGTNWHITSGWNGFFGLGNALVGTSSPQLPILTQAGAANLTFTTGVASLTFPNAFPNALIAVYFTGQMGSVEPISLIVDSTSVGLSGCDVGAHVNGSPYGSTLTFSWRADGQ